MNNKNKQNKIVELIKINLTICNIQEKIILSTIIFFVITYIITNQLMKFGYGNNLNINAWDGIFRLLSYDSFIIGFYIPFIVIITTFFNTKNDYLKFMMLRINTKKTLVVSKIIINLIISLIFLTIFFSGLLIINFLVLRFEWGWSKTILSKDSLRIVYHLYPNFFVYYFTPLRSLAISFGEIFIASFIVLNLRDIFINYIGSKYKAYLIMSGYLILNIMCNGFALNEGIFKIHDYIGLDKISLLYKHNFNGSKDFSLTLGTSIIVSLIYLSLTIFTNLLLSKRLVIEND